MAASRKAQDLKAKEAKQKKILAIGVVLLVVVAVIQLPKVLHRGGAGAAATPAPTTVPATAATPPAASATPATAPPASLADTDVPPAPATGKLIHFDRFASKDPFVPQVTSTTAAAPAAAPPTAAAAPPPAAAKAPATTTTAAPTTPTSLGAYATPPAPSVPTTAVAKLTVNGAAEQVQADHEFPAAAPAFRLVGFSNGEAKISVAGGSFQSGAPTIALVKGHPLTLMNTTDGTRFVLLYRGAAKVPTADLPPAPTTTTTTTATTTTTTPSAG